MERTLRTRRSDQHGQKTEKQQESKPATQELARGDARDADQKGEPEPFRRQHAPPPDRREHDHDRITWDAPIHSWADVEALPFAPRVLNSKPSRFGPVSRLFEFYDRCAEAGISLYGGGQFELGVGRGQAQYLASIFHADTPNDLAPSAYNEEPPPTGLPSSPLAAEPSATGFRWGD